MGIQPAEASCLFCAIDHRRRVRRPGQAGPSRPELDAAARQIRAAAATLP